MTEQTYAPELATSLKADFAEIVARYPQPRSALLPMLHLVQSVDGYVSARGIAACAEALGITRAEVSAVATFYSQYKRHPNGEYNVGVCTNALCAVMGGDQIFETLSDHLGVGHDETTADGRITLEQLECNAACDYAPVVMVNWEFFDNQTPTSATQLVDEIAAGRPVHPTRGATTVGTFKEISRVLAGFEDGRADEGPGAGEASLLGLRIARANGWTSPHEGHEADRHAPLAEAAGAAPVGDTGSSAAHQVPTSGESDPGAARRAVSEEDK
ncbi:NADH-quinone oxidoreductase subunit NuoE [Georgenia sp. Z1491]|uniref:NADH-quinone oxidoreductase subunit NuoE n=1 Tax=Georgenia sp. Z1491 TaxID=3416707 RepID=UPI003CE933C7